MIKVAINAGHTDNGRGVNESAVLDIVVVILTSRTTFVTGQLV